MSTHETEPVSRPDVSEPLRLEQHIEAPPDAVFEFFVDPEKLKRWMGTETRLDPTPGGEFWVDMNGGDDVAQGEFVEIDRPHRVSFTWGWIGNDGVPPGSSTVTIDLREERGGTTVVLTHAGLPNDEARASHTEGWNFFLGRFHDLNTYD